MKDLVINLVQTIMAAVGHYDKDGWIWKIMTVNIALSEENGVRMNSAPNASCRNRAQSDCSV